MRPKRWRGLGGGAVPPTYPTLGDRPASGTEGEAAHILSLETTYKWMGTRSGGDVNEWVPAFLYDKSGAYAQNVSGDLVRWCTPSSGKGSDGAGSIPSGWADVSDPGGSISDSGGDTLLNGGVNYVSGAIEFSGITNMSNPGRVFLILKIDNTTHLTSNPNSWLGATVYLSDGTHLIRIGFNYTNIRNNIGLVTNTGVGIGTGAVTINPLQTVHAVLSHDLPAAVGSGLIHLFKPDEGYYGLSQDLITTYTSIPTPEILPRKLTLFAAGNNTGPSPVMTVREVHAFIMD